MTVSNSMTLNQKDAAAYLGVSVNTLKKYEAEGRIKRTGAGRSTYNKRDLELLMGQKDDREELKTENEFLRKENQDLRSKIEQIERILR